MNKSESENVEETGIIGQYYENKLPVIVKFVNVLPETEITNKFKTLVVISWKYNGDENNGMPFKNDNTRMILLEDLIMNSDLPEKSFVHAYSRTGNNLKELVFYCETQKEFMALINKTLANQERFPIEIFFYEDKEWSEFKTLLKDFKK